MRISLAMIVKNEENNIRECLNSVKEIVDEIVVVDTGSNDNTIKIAEEFNAKVYEFQWCDDFAAARNYSLEKATGDWILVLDADECVSIGDRRTLEEFIKLNGNAIGSIEQHNKFEENNDISFSSEYISRFFPKGIKFEGLVHEQLVSRLRSIKMHFRVEHTGYYKVNKSERNLNLLLNMLKDDPNDSYVLYQIGRTLYVDKKYKKCQEYFEKCYEMINVEYPYRRGLVIYYLYSIVNSNLNYEKGLEIINNEKDKYFNDADFNFVCGIFYMNLILYNIDKYSGYLNHIEKCYLNCLDIGEENSIVEGVGSFKAAYNLGTFYEVTGKIKLACEYYIKSAQHSFEPAKRRIKELNLEY